jgi:predicted transcriptional regulator
MPTTTFSMRIDEGVKKRVEEIAKREERSASYIAEKAIKEFLSREQAVRDAVQEALDNDDGRRTSGEAVIAWMARWADGYDDPMPEADGFRKPQAFKKSA